MTSTTTAPTRIIADQPPIVAVLGNLSGLPSETAAAYRAASDALRQATARQRDTRQRITAARARVVEITATLPDAPTKQQSDLRRERLTLDADLSYAPDDASAATKALAEATITWAAAAMAAISASGHEAAYATAKKTFGDYAIRVLGAGREMSTEQLGEAIRAAADHYEAVDQTADAADADHEAGQVVMRHVATLFAPVRVFNEADSAFRTGRYGYNWVAMSRKLGGLPDLLADHVRRQEGG